MGLAHYTRVGAGIETQACCLKSFCSFFSLFAAIW